MSVMDLYRKLSRTNTSYKFKGKIISIYESYFRGFDPTVENSNFWNEVFLIKPNIMQLEEIIANMSTEHLIEIKGNIRKLTLECVKTINQGQKLSVGHAMLTLCGLVTSIAKKQETSVPDFDVIDLLMSPEDMNDIFKILVENVYGFIADEVPSCLKSMSLKLLIMFVTITDGLSKNPLLEYLMVHEIFEKLIQLLKQSPSRVQFGQDVVVLLTLLTNYKKLESTNPYAVKFSILDDEVALNGFAQVISFGLTTFCREFAGHHTEPSGGWLTSITSMMSLMFVGGGSSGQTTVVSSDEGKGSSVAESNSHLASSGSSNSWGLNSMTSNTLSAGGSGDHTSDFTLRMRGNQISLLALYEAVHLNRNFFTVLVHAAPQPSELTNPTSPLSLSTSSSSPLSSTNDLTDPMLMPSTLLGTFFQYCSLLMQDTKTESRANMVKLCFLILTCISEDQYSNALMHDPNLVFHVHLHRLPMRHRKALPKSRSQPLAASLHDLLVEFIISHMMKRNLPLELYFLCIGVMFRLVCYQKRCRVRLQYQWKESWTALTTFLKFIIANENYLIKKANFPKNLDIFELSTQMINIFNIFITYGDTFLPYPSSYDEFYYEIIRMRQVFEDLNSMALRYASDTGRYRHNALKLSFALVNIKSIINHFSPRIESWLEKHSISTPTEEQILEIVTMNYTSLVLKLIENLDHYERYSENPQYTEFFEQIVRSVVRDTKHRIDFGNVNVLISEFVVTESSPSVAMNQSPPSLIELVPPI